VVAASLLHWRQHGGPPGSSHAQRARAAGAELLDVLKAGNTCAAMRLLQGNILPDLGVTDEVGGRHRNIQQD
jgi:hypothetical protein